MLTPEISSNFRIIGWVCGGLSLCSGEMVESGSQLDHVAVGVKLVLTVGFDYKRNIFVLGYVSISVWLIFVHKCNISLWHT